MVHNYRWTVTGLLLTASININAANTPLEHYLIAPKCLIKDLPVTVYQKVSSNANYVLIKASEPGINQLIELKFKNRAIVCGGFDDVTIDFLKNPKQDPKTFLDKETTTPPQTNRLLEKPYTIKHEKEVNALIKQVDSQAIWANLTKFTKFPDRYANSDTGVQATKWLKNKIVKIATDAGRSDDLSVTFVDTTTGFYKQPSVVVKFGKSDEPGIVIGGHMDTLSNLWNGDKPGADDDGSGSMTVMEAARTIINSGMSFKKPIYFIWYAAEEEGLYGSKAVVNYFTDKGIKVDAVLQFDMTGYVSNKNDATMWLINDNVDQSLTSFTGDLIKNYLKVPVNYTRCGYACSDNASWYKKGVPASFPFEAQFGHDNPDIHSSRDTMEKLSLDHMTNFAKLGVAFAVELAEPV